MESEFWSINSMPDFPETFATSWGSVTTVVTPLGTRSFENSLGVTIDDSMWTCPSMNVGEMYFPFASTTLFPSYWPIPTITPSAIAISASMMESVKTSIIFPFFTTRSAGVFLLATASCFFKVVFSHGCDSFCWVFILIRVLGLIDGVWWCFERLRRLRELFVLLVEGR